MCADAAARRGRRRRRALARGHRAAARPRPGSRWWRRPATPTTSCARRSPIAPTCGRATSRCRPATATMGCGPRWSSAAGCRETGVLVLSQFYEEQYALDLIGDRPEGVGYLLKERVGDVEAFIDAVARVAAGGSALDPEVVGRMLGRRRADGPLDDAQPARARRARRHGRGQVEPRHRRGARRDRGRGREARDRHLPQARARAHRRPSIRRVPAPCSTYLRRLAG